MKLTEKIVGVLMLLGILMKLLSLIGQDIVIVVSFTLQATIYFYLGFALFNGIRLRKILKKESFEGIKSGRMIGAILFGMALSTTVIGLMFFILSLPGSGIMINVGAFGIGIALVVALIRYLVNKSKFYKGIFIRIAIYGIPTVAALIIGEEEFLKFKYRNHPEIYKEIMYFREHPNAEPGDYLEEVNGGEQEENELSGTVLAELPTDWVSLTEKKGKYIIYNSCDAGNAQLKLNKDSSELLIWGTQEDITIKYNKVLKSGSNTINFLDSSGEEIKFTWLDKEKEIASFTIHQLNEISIVCVAAEKQDQYEVFNQPCVECWGEECDD